MGAKLCKISFLSEHARRGNLKPAELHDQIASISDTSREVLHSLDEIVWAVNPQNDTLEHVASYIGQYAQDYFQMTGILCELEIPAQLPPHPLPSQIRHHLFLATQEALTNILKHSGATHARISMICHDETFEITVADDGKSFLANGKRLPATESPVAESGNGLRNMRQRLTDIGGQCSVESARSAGTTDQVCDSPEFLGKNPLTALITLMISVSIVDDEKELRQSIATFVNGAPGFRCISDYGTAEAALKGLPADRPEVVLMDINLGGMNGIECVERLTTEAPDMQILMLTVYEDTDQIYKALAAGASGYLLKRSSPTKLLQAIREVHAGGSPMSSSIARKVVASFQKAKRTGEKQTHLSPREEMVLDCLLAKGLTYKQIADTQLGISIDTIRTYIRRIL